MIILLWISFFSSISEKALVITAIWHIPLLVRNGENIKCITPSNLECQWHDNTYKKHSLLDYITEKSDSEDIVENDCSLNVYDWLVSIKKVSGVVDCSITGLYHNNIVTIVVQTLVYIDKDFSKNSVHCDPKYIMFTDYFRKSTNLVPHVCYSGGHYLDLSHLSKEFMPNAYIHFIENNLPSHIILPKYDLYETITVLWNEESVTNADYIRQRNVYWLWIDVNLLLDSDVNVGVITVIYRGSGGPIGLSIVIHVPGDIPPISRQHLYQINESARKSRKQSSTLFQYESLPNMNSTSKLVHFLSHNRTRNSDDIYVLNILCNDQNCQYRVNRKSMHQDGKLINGHINNSTSLYLPTTKMDTFMSNSFPLHSLNHSTSSGQNLNMSQVSKLIYFSFFGSLILIVISLLVLTINCIKKRRILCYADEKNIRNELVWMSNDKYGIKDSLLPEYSRMSLHRVQNNNNKYSGRYSEQITQCTGISSEEKSMCIPSYTAITFDQASNSSIQSCLPLFFGDIPESNIKLEVCIGSGAFGKVFLGKINYIDIGKCKVQHSIAAKEIMHSESTTSTLFSEMSLMKQIGYHSNIVTLIGYCKRENLTDLLIIEFCSKGSLKSYLNNLHGRDQFPLSTFKRFSDEIALGMEYLASKNIIHRDLAARNVLLSERYVCKISDFGLSRQLPVNESYYRHVHGVIPLKWMAPEVLAQHKYSTQADVWSYGILLWEIFSVGTNPYENFPMSQVNELINHGYRMPIPARCPATIAKLIENCWNFEPSLRPTFKDIVGNL